MAIALVDMPDVKKTRGGAGRGQGRKKSGLTKTCIPVSLDNDLIEWLAAFGKRNRSKVINAQVRKLKDEVEQKSQQVPIQ